MRRSLIVCVLVAGTVCAGQAPPKKSAPKKPTEHATFVCPDAEAQQACKSYQELLKAKDTGLPTSDAYVCFRKKTDEFFVVHISQPYFPQHWDKESKQMVADESPRPGFGYVQTYKDGVLDSNTMPTLSFSGQWQRFPFSESSVFNADTIYLTKLDKNDPNVGVFIDETQDNIGYKYKNTFDKTMQYTLTIQRSTGRFAERFLEEAEKVPLLDRTGYCAYH